MATTYNVIRRPGSTREIHHWDNLNDALVGGVLVATPVVIDSGIIHSILLVANAIDVMYLKLYNKSTLVTTLSDEPDWQLYLDASTNIGIGRYIQLPTDLGTFSGGLQVALSGAQDKAATVPLASTVILDLTVDVPSA